MAEPDSAVFAGASPELQGLLRGIDWAATPLGQVRTWSPLLRLMVQMTLRSGFATEIHWGRDLVTIYNDAHVPFRGNRHPDGLGRAMREVWPETWDRAGPRFDEVLGGVTLRFDDERQILHRHGYPEECYFTFAQSPIVNLDGSIAGVMTVATETTGKVLSERRMRVVRELGALSAAESGGLERTCAAALAVLTTARESVPFAAAFLADRDSRPRARQVAAYGFAQHAEATVLTALSGAAEAVAATFASGRLQVLNDLRATSGDALTPGPIGDLLPDVAVVLPLSVSGQGEPIGALLLGVNPYRPLDEAYLSFVDVIGRQLRVAVTDAVAHETERSRLRALADLDRTKTEFFQNVSHELRTPLTLLLGPLQDLLAAAEHGSADSTVTRQDLRAAVSAAERLRVMVDALLDESMTQSGFLSPKQRPTDLVTATAEAAAMFRSTAEHQGLEFEVTLPDEELIAAVDGSMWSTIVTNLLSNAVKYTAAGGISLSLSASAGDAVLTVSDTGRGIDRAQQARVFERFYRADARGAAAVDEGSPEDGDGSGISSVGAAASPGAGIGLALVQDLVTLHRGRVDLTSSPGQGTTVSVTVPLGISWVPNPTPAPSQDGADTRPTVLVVEDDPDLRSYLGRLLEGDGWAVTAVADAESAEQAAFSPVPDAVPDVVPDVVVTDVMLPGASGLQLVARLRKDPRTARLPVIIVTGRGGPDAAGDGLAAGADDYVTKPFSSRELLARVRANHELHLLREGAVDAAQTRADQIRGALESNRVVGTAIGIVMATYHLTAEQAFRLLTVASQNTNSKLRDIAAAVVESGALPYRRTVVDDLLEQVGRESQRKR